MSKDRFDTRMATGRPLLLDGGLATQLEAQGEDIDNTLWSASLLQTNPEAIVAAHEAFLLVGAECLLTASYQASREGFAQLGVDANAADDLMQSSVELAQQAKSRQGSSAMIAASLGPYGAMLHDGSEYTGDYDISRGVISDFHSTRLELFDSTDVDVLALETIPSLQEAAVLADLLRECSTPSWVSFSCKDAERISDGTPLEVVVEQFVDHSNVRGIGINCTPPQYAPALVSKLHALLPDKHILAYPNSGETYKVETNAWIGTATAPDYADASRQWLDAGATIVGGCCRVSPAHIAAMSTELSKRFCG